MPTAKQAHAKPHEWASLSPTPMGSVSPKAHKDAVPACRTHHGGMRDARPLITGDGPRRQLYALDETLEGSKNVPTHFANHLDRQIGGGLRT